MGKHGVYPHSRESLAKRARRPIFHPSDHSHPIRGLLPEEIAAFYARVDAARQKLLARQAVSALRKSAQAVRSRTLNSSSACPARLR